MGHSPFIDDLPTYKPPFWSRIFKSHLYGDTAVEKSREIPVELRISSAACRRFTRRVRSVRNARNGRWWAKLPWAKMKHAPKISQPNDIHTSYIYNIGLSHHACICIHIYIYTYILEYQLCVYTIYTYYNLIQYHNIQSLSLLDINSLSCFSGKMQVLLQNKMSSAKLLRSTVEKSIKE